MKTLLPNIQKKLSEFTGITLEDIEKELNSPDQKKQDADEIWRKLDWETKVDILRNNNYEI